MQALAYVTPPFAATFLGRTGAQLFLCDREDGREPLLVRLAAAALAGSAVFAEMYDRLCPQADRQGRCMRLASLKGRAQTQHALPQHHRCARPCRCA